MTRKSVDVIKTVVAVFAFVGFGLIVLDLVKKTVNLVLKKNIELTYPMFG